MGSMQITVRLYASLRERAGVGELVLKDLEPGVSVAGAKARLLELHPELGSLEGVRGVLGTNYVDDGETIDAADELHLLPPVSGGEADPMERGVFELSGDALDPGRAIERVGHPAFGGTVLFSGTTREHNRGQAVVTLDYEAFEAMSGPEMQRIFSEALERFGPPSATADGAAGQEPGELRLRMLVQHRTGVVGVGETSVLVAVASPHRDAAFGAARFLIDELKGRLPVWKKEVYRDGHHWIGDRS